MKKNVKGFIGLFAGIAAIVLAAVALFVPTYQIKGSSLSLHGDFNVYISLIGALLGLAAIIFGIISLKGKDKKGPRKSGIVIGVIAIIVSLIISGVCVLFREIVNYANDVPGNYISTADKETKEKVDKMIQEIRDKFPEK